MEQKPLELTIEEIECDPATGNPGIIITTNKPMSPSELMLLIAEILGSFLQEYQAAMNTKRKILNH